jgi:hypothetical protein
MVLNREAGPGNFGNPGKQWKVNAFGNDHDNTFTTGLV